MSGKIKRHSTGGLIQKITRAVHLLPQLTAYKLFYTKKIALYDTLSEAEKTLLTKPWYHDFSVLGIKTVQVPGFWKPNQQAKEQPLFTFIERAILLCREEKMSAKGAELFCADGFYGNHAATVGADQVLGVDLDDRHLAKAVLMTKLLGNSEKVTFNKCDVFDLAGKYDFGICAGGLYHISNPFDLLKLMTQKIRKALVIQTIYSLANDSKDYFETPAPGWTGGCRFSYPYLAQMVDEAGWKILAEAKNELAGNKRPEDRGSAYMLCINKNDPVDP